MTGLTERFRTGHGNMYITVNFDESGRPFEMFAALGKAGGCDSAQLEAMSRLASLSLRSGVDPREIVNNLQGITCCPTWDEGTQVKSAPDAMAHMLKRILGGEISPGIPGEYGRLTCPECSGPVDFREGCEICTSHGCGWTRCQ